MSKHVPLVTSAVLGLVLITGQPAWAQAEDLDPDMKEKVAAAISRGIEFLRGSSEAGVWFHDRGLSGVSEQNIGATALVAIALLEAKVELDDPQIKSVMTLIRNTAPRMKYTYTLCLALILLEREKDKDGNHAHGALLLEMTRKLEAGMHKDRGNWGYYSPALGNDTDNSNTQFALLALWISRRHEPCKAIAEACIRRAAQHFRATQNQSGGWGYVGKSNPTLSMTAAGLLALGMEHALKLQERLQQAELTGVDVGSIPNKPAPRPQRIVPEWEKDPAVVNGFDYLDKTFPKLDATFDHLTYIFWSIERVGLIYHRKTLGKTLWYPFGAKLLIEMQRPDGGWAVDVRHGANVDTALALLFLCQSNLVGEIFEAKLRSGGKVRELMPARPAVPPPAPPKSGKDLTAEEIRKLGTELPFAAGPRLDEILEQLSEAKNSAASDVFRQALIGTAVRDVSRPPIRKAFANRLSRMKVENIRYYLGEPEREMRVVGAMAAGIKKNGYLVPDLIPLLAERDRPIGDAAYEALKATTNQDLGRRDPEKWNKWWQEQGSKAFGGK